MREYEGVRQWRIKESRESERLYCDNSRKMAYFNIPQTNSAALTFIVACLTFEYAIANSENVRVSRAP